MSDEIKTLNRACDALSEAAGICAAMDVAEEFRAARDGLLALVRARLSPEPAALEKWQESNECKVCGNRPDEQGVLTHGKGCYVMSEDGGGEEYIDGAPEPAAPDAGVEQTVEKIRSLVLLGGAHRPGIEAILTAHTAALRRERDMADALLGRAQRERDAARADLAAAVGLLELVFDENRQLRRTYCCEPTGEVIITQLDSDVERFLADRKEEPK